MTKACDSLIFDYTFDESEHALRHYWDLIWISRGDTWDYWALRSRRLQQEKILRTITKISFLINWMHPFLIKVYIYVIYITFLTLLNGYVSLFPHQYCAARLFSTLIIIRNVSWAAYYYDFWRLCDTEDWINNAENRFNHRKKLV